MDESNTLKEMEQMKIHVLGYWGTYPSPGEATTGFLIDTDGQKVLLDCGSGVLAQLFKVCGVEDLTAVVITHHHYDHTADLGVLGYAVQLSRITGKRSTAIPFYLPERAVEFMHDLNAEPFIDVNIIDVHSHVHIGNLAFSFAATKHPAQCYAVKCTDGEKSFVFSADSSVCPELGRFAGNADLFLCEASMYDGQEETALHTGHLTARQAATIAREAGVKQLALTHYPHYGDLRELFEQALEAFGKSVIQVHTLDELAL